MDAFIDSLVQLLIQWGYLGIFLSALLAGSILPFSSELVLAALVGIGLNPTLALLCAAIGNTVGGLTCYAMGLMGKVEWIEKYLKVERAKVERMQRFLHGRGALMAFFTFLPFVGEAIAVALGFMRANPWLVTLSMFAGKLTRYACLLWAFDAVIN